MKKIIFWISLSVFVFYGFIKYTFISIEPNFITNLSSKIDIVVLFISAFIVLVLYLFDKDKEVGKKGTIGIKESLKDPVNIFLLMIISSVLLVSIIFNFNKKSLDWDAVALYDSRAKILMSGYKFSEMNKLSEYDDKNKYYYLLYPPFTTIQHFIWYGFDTGIAVGVIYSASLVLLAIILGVIFYEYIGLKGSLFSVFLIISNKGIFNTSLVEYTNLPFTIFIVAGTMLILLGLKLNKYYFHILGLTLIASSTWIRYLEPVWLVVFIALLITAIYLKRFKKMIPLLLLGFLVILSQYLSWGDFQKNVASSPAIFTITPFIVFESIVGIFTGSLLNIFIYYITSFGVIVVIYLFSLIKINKSEPPEYLFIRLIVLISLLMYLVGIYGISFMFDWWREMSGSLVRSSSYLIPLSVFLIVSNLKYLLENNLKRDQTTSVMRMFNILTNAKK